MTNDRAWPELLPARLEVDDEGKATNIKLLSFARPNMRSFHLSWLGFFSAFTTWFAISPLLKKTIGPDLKLSPADIANSDIANVASTVVFRVAVGPLVDKFGPSRTMTILLICGSLPLALSGLVSNATGLITLRAFVGLIGASFVPCQYWATAMFNRKVVGTANAIAAGWGNMGGGFTYLLMPQVFAMFVAFGLSDRVAWRVAIIIPFVICTLVGILCWRFGDDKPLLPGLPTHTPNTTKTSTIPQVPLLDETSSETNGDTVTFGTAVHEASTPGSSTQNLAMPGDEVPECIDAMTATTDIHVEQKRTESREMENAPDHTGDSLPKDHHLPAHIHSGRTRKSTAQIMATALMDPNVWILMLHQSSTLIRAITLHENHIKKYACCFGVELAVDSHIASYLLRTFLQPTPECARAAARDPDNIPADCSILNQQTAGYLASIFGLMNLFSRATGGFLSDYCFSRFGGMRGRMGLQALFFLCNGSALIWFSFATRSLGEAVGAMVIFSFFTQATCGSSFGIVPYVNPEIMGAVSGLVGAGGNIGGALFNLLFLVYVNNPHVAFEIMGLVVLIGGSLSTLALRIKGEGLFKWRVTTSSAPECN